MANSAAGTALGWSCVSGKLMNTHLTLPVLMYSRSSAGKVVTQKSRQKGHWKSLISYTVTGASALPLVREPRSWAAAGVARTAHSDRAAARRKAVTRSPVRVSFCPDGRTRPGPVLKLPKPTRILLVLQLILTQVAL